MHASDPHALMCLEMIIIYTFSEKKAAIVEFSGEPALSDAEGYEF